MFGIARTQDTQYCVIGLGVFGRNLCRHLAQLSAQVLAIDCREENVAAVKDYVAGAIEVDFNNLARFENYSLEAMDAVFIAIGDDFEASMTLTVQLKEMKVKKLIVRSLSPMHDRLLKLLGVDRIVVPEEFAARGLAHSIMMRGAVDGYDLGDGHIIVEAETPAGLVGRTLREATDKFRRNSILLVTIKRRREDSGESELHDEAAVDRDLRLEDRDRLTLGVPKQADRFEKSDVLVLFGEETNLREFLDELAREAPAEPAP
ncbi:MAG: potassium channel family protein [Candidatus Spyradosoma sp.]